MFLIDPYRFGTPSVPDPYYAYTNLLMHIDNILPTDVVEDFSAFGLDGALSGATLSTVMYKWGGGSAQFSTASRGIEVPIGPSPFLRFDMNVPTTWECWCWEDSTGPTSAVLFSNRSAGTARGWVIANTYVQGYIDSSWQASFLSWPRPAFDTWNHIAVQTEGSGPNAMRVFVNGVPVAYRTFGSIENSTSPTSIQIGSASSSGEAPFKGFIDDVRFTRGIARYPAGGFTPPAGPFANSAP